MNTTKAVYKAIADVSAEIAKSGISKDRKNEQQGYKFRGIDDVYNALAPMLAKHGLVILPRILTRSRARALASHRPRSLVVDDVPRRPPATTDRDYAPPDEMGGPSY